MTKLEDSELGGAEFVAKDRDWFEYPLGTKAHAHGGGYWIRVERGWQWHLGDTFPRPGGDVNLDKIELPWEPFRVAAYDPMLGGYPVERFDGVPCARFIVESEAEFCVKAINAECRRKGHTGFGENEK